MSYLAEPPVLAVVVSDTTKHLSTRLNTDCARLTTSSGFDGTGGAGGELAEGEIHDVLRNDRRRMVLELLGDVALGAATHYHVLGGVALSLSGPGVDRLHDEVVVLGPNVGDATVEGQRR